MTKEAHMAFKIESSLLDACALAILHRGDTYGYEITQEMKKSITVSESTLYPVLRRLQQEQLCMTYDQPYQGRNRRYYRITEKGEAQLQDYLKQWDDYRNAVQRLLDGPEAAKKEAVKGSAKEEPEKEPAKESEKEALKAGSKAGKTGPKKGTGKKADSKEAKKENSKEAKKEAKEEKKASEEGGAADE